MDLEAAFKEWWEASYGRPPFTHAIMTHVSFAQYIHDRLSEPPADSVNHPPHYTQTEIECIDAIKAALGADGFHAYCKGQVIKYLWRAEHKGNRIEDLRKAQWYMERMIVELI